MLRANAAHKHSSAWSGSPKSQSLSPVPARAHWKVALAWEDTKSWRDGSRSLCGEITAGTTALRPDSQGFWPQREKTVENEE